MEDNLSKQNLFNLYTKLLDIWEAFKWTTNNYPLFAAHNGNQYQPCLDGEKIGAKKKKENHTKASIPPPAAIASRFLSSNDKFHNAPAASCLFQSADIIYIKTNLLRKHIIILCMEKKEPKVYDYRRDLLLWISTKNEES